MHAFSATQFRKVYDDQIKEENMQRVFVFCSNDCHEYTFSQRFPTTRDLRSSLKSVDENLVDVNYLHDFTDMFTRVSSLWSPNSRTYWTSCSRKNLKWNEKMIPWVNSENSLKFYVTCTIRYILPSFVFTIRPLLTNFFGSAKAIRRYTHYKKIIYCLQSKPKVSCSEF